MSIRFVDYRALNLTEDEADKYLREYFDETNGWPIAAQSDHQYFLYEKYELRVLEEVGEELNQTPSQGNIFNLAVYRDGDFEEEKKIGWEKVEDELEEYSIL